MGIDALLVAIIYIVPAVCAFNRPTPVARDAFPPPFQLAVAKPLLNFKECIRLVNKSLLLCPHIMPSASSVVTISIFGTNGISSLSFPNQSFIFGILFHRVSDTLKLQRISHNKSPIGSGRRGEGFDTSSSEIVSINLAVTDLHYSLVPHRYLLRILTYAGNMVAETTLLAPSNRE